MVHISALPRFPCVPSHPALSSTSGLPSLPLLPSGSCLSRLIASVFRAFSPERIHIWLLRLVLLLPGVDADFASVVRSYLSGTFHRKTHLPTHKSHVPIASLVGLRPTLLIPGVPRSHGPASFPDIGEFQVWSRLVDGGSSSNPFLYTPPSDTSSPESSSLSPHLQLLDDLVSSTACTPVLPLQTLPDNPFVPRAGHGPRGSHLGLRLNETELSTTPSYEGFPKNACLVPMAPPTHRLAGRSTSNNFPIAPAISQPVLFHNQDYYYLNGLLGEGTYARVMHATSSGGLDVAIKGLYKRWAYSAMNGRQMLLREKEILCRATLAQKRFLANLLASWDDGDFVHLVMPLYPETLLHRLFGKNKIPQEEVKHYAAELIIALKQLRDIKCVHRDIKPENILISSTGHLSLSDFGCSYPLPERGNSDIEKFQMTDYVGTPGYTAPEVYPDYSPQKYYTSSADIWSMGVVLWELMTGKRLFQDQTEEDIERNVRYSLIDCSDITDTTARHLVEIMLTPNPSFRPALKVLMIHPYFDDINWAMVENHQYTPRYKPRLPYHDPNATEFLRPSFLTCPESDSMIVDAQLQEDSRGVACGKNPYKFVCPQDRFPAHLYP